LNPYRGKLREPGTFQMIDVINDVLFKKEFTNIKLVADQNLEVEERAQEFRKKMKDLDTEMEAKKKEKNRPLTNKE